jgi:5-methyltetrahydrofolate--homocysteine methyltransferase
MSVEDIFQSILQLKRDEITDLVQAEIDAGTDVSVILEEGLIDAMGEVGSQFSSGYLFVPEMLEAARTMKTGLQVLRPLLADADIAPRGTVVIGTVKGDVHDIGKDLVGMMLEGAGFEVFDLGVNVAPKAFMDAAVENQAQLVAMSALLTTSMPVMGECIREFKDAGIGARIIVGGAPITQDYAIKINADGYGSDAPGAVELATSLVPKQGS